eukprot:1149303-Pelagomonas_calceolata.AAC.5
MHTGAVTLYPFCLEGAAISHCMAILGSDAIVADFWHTLFSLPHPAHTYRDCIHCTQTISHEQSPVQHAPTTCPTLRTYKLLGLKQVLPGQPCQGSRKSARMRERGGAVLLKPVACSTLGSPLPASAGLPACN